jgi:hypothetical protein
MNVKNTDSDTTKAASRAVRQTRVMDRVGACSVLVAGVFGAALGCNSVLGIDDATLCGDSSCDGGVPAFAAEGTPANLPGAANPPGSTGSDAAVPPTSPLGGGELGVPGDVPLTPSETPADNSGSGNSGNSGSDNSGNAGSSNAGAGNAGNAGPGSGSDNSGAGSGSGDGNAGGGSSGEGNGNGNGNSGSDPGGGDGSDDDDPPPVDEPTTPPPTTPPPTQPPPPSPCDGRINGEAFCNGVTRIACGPGESVTSTLTCASAEHCAQATGPLCAACLTGEARCDGAALSVCNATHSGFDIQPCAGPQFCNVAQARCDAPACQPNEVRCEGAFLQVCNATLTGFDPIADCGVATACNASTASCNICAPGTSRCLDLTTVATCDAAGQAEVVSGCPLLQTCDSGDCRLLGGL